MKEILINIIPIITITIGASLTYFFTKKKEIDAKLQKEKLNFYIEFISSLTDNLESRYTKEGGKKFARASNNLYLFANTKVISALKNFQKEIKKQIVIEQKKKKQKPWEI